MSVSYRALTGLNPRAFLDAGSDMSKAVGKLTTEYRQYKSLVLRPLQHRYGWRGGGQADAAVVAKVNGLAVDTMRLRAATGGLAFMYAYAGFSLAQQQLASLCRKIDSDGMKVDADGNVSAKDVPIGDDGGLGSTSARAMGYRLDMGKVLKFATIVDDVTAAALNGGHEPPVTGLTNRPGLLDEARKDHGDAEDDAAGMLAEFRTLPATAAGNLPLDNDLPGIPGVDLQLPPGQAGNTFGMGLFIMGLFLEGGSIGAGMGGQLEIAIPAGLTGLICMELGGALIRANGGTVPRVSIAGRGMPADNPGTDASLDKLMQQANRLEKEVGPHHKPQTRITSKIGDDPGLMRSAEQAGRNQTVQRDLNHMIHQLSRGNMNPGTENRTLPKTDVHYARMRSGARLFFRNTSDGIQVVGKADKHNEGQVIARLRKLYGR